MCVHASLAYVCPYIYLQAILYIYTYMYDVAWPVYIHILTYTYTCTKIVAPDAKHQHQYAIMWLRSLRKECT